MKRLLIFAISLLLCQFLNAQFVWTDGSGDHQWSNAANWTGATGYPNLSTDDVEFPNGSVVSSIVLSENIQVGRFIWNEETANKGLNLGNYNFTVHSRANFGLNTSFIQEKSDGTISFLRNINIIGSAKLLFYNMNHSSESIYVGKNSMLTFEAADNPINIHLNSLNVVEFSTIIFNSPVDVTFASTFDIDGSCLVAFPANQTTYFNGLVEIDGDCTSRSVIKSSKSGTVANLTFSVNSTADYQIFENINILGSTTLDAHDKVLLGASTNIGGTSKLPETFLSINSGSWSDPTIWNLGCIPTAIDSVNISSMQTITVNNFALVNAISFANDNASIVGSTDSDLEVFNTINLFGTNSINNFKGTIYLKSSQSSFGTILSNGAVFNCPIIMQAANSGWRIIDDLDINFENGISFLGEEGSLDFTNFSIVLNGDFEMGENTHINGNLGALVLQGTNPSSIEVKGSGAFNKITIQKVGSHGVLKSDIEVASSFKLLTGNLVLNENTLKLGPMSHFVGGSINSYVEAHNGVTGKVKKIFCDGLDNQDVALTIPIGDPINYTPLSFTLNSSSVATCGSASIDFSVTNTAHTLINELAPDIYLKRFWDVEPTAITNPNYDISLHYLDTDLEVVNPIGEESDLITVKNSSNKWLWNENNSTVNTTDNILSWSGITSFSSFTGSGGGAILPLELLSFEANCEGGETVKLDWVTATEIDVDFIEVQRSLNGNSGFVTLTKLNAIGGVEQTEYSYEDQRGLSQGYYRLKIVDLDGSYTFSEIRSTNCTKGSFSINEVFPNPTFGEVMVNFETTDRKNLNYKLIDVLGRVIYQDMITPDLGFNSLTIDLQGLSKGMYFIVLQNDKKEIAQKIMKN